MSILRKPNDYSSEESQYQSLLRYQPSQLKGFLEDPNRSSSLKNTYHSSQIWNTTGVWGRTYIVILNINALSTAGWTNMDTIDLEAVKLNEFLDPCCLDTPTSGRNLVN
jgi:hypothetical protein